MDGWLLADSSQRPDNKRWLSLLRPDNAAMIAAAGIERFERFGSSPLDLAAAAQAPLG